MPETDLDHIDANNNRIGEKSMPPMLGSMAQALSTGSEICQISSIAGCRLPGATQLTMIMAIRMKKYRLTSKPSRRWPRQQCG